MKKLIYFAAGLIFCSQLLNAAEIKELLSNGLIEEEANFNLESAESLYREALQKFEQDQKLAATALYRLSEIRRKQGKKEESEKFLEEVWLKFPVLAEAMGVKKVAPQDLFQTRLNTIGGRRQAGTSGIDQARAEIRKWDNAKALLNSTADLRLENYFSPQQLTNDTEIRAIREKQNELHFSLQKYKESHPRIAEIRGEIQGLLTKKFQAELDKATLELANATGPKKDEISPATKQKIDELEKVLTESPDLLNAVVDFNNGGTRLHDAASKSDLDLARFLINKGARLDVRDKAGNHAIHSAAQRGHKAMVELLLNSGVPVNVKTVYGYTPLHSAVSGGHAQLSQFLIAKGADISAVSQHGETILMPAIARDDTQLLDLVLKAGADINASTMHGTALTLAIQQGHLEAASYLIDKGADVNQAGKGGLTPLMAVAAYLSNSRSLPIAVQLIEKRAEMDVILPKEAGVQRSLIETTIERTNYPLLELLLKKGANPNLTAQPDGFTPLLTAANKRDSEAVKILLVYKADPNILGGSERYLPIHLAVSGRKLEVLKELIAAKSDINSPDKRGRRPLDLALTAGPEFVEVLKAAGAEFSKIDIVFNLPDGSTPKMSFNKPVMISEALRQLEPLEFVLSSIEIKRGPSQRIKIANHEIGEIRSGGRKDVELIEGDIVMIIKNEINK